MVELLQRYSLSDILIFFILLALSVKSLISFFDWLQSRFRKGYDKFNAKQNLQKQVEKTQQVINVLQNNQQSTNAALNGLSNKINMLIQSDKDDIKSYITREHHYFCYQKGWIDDFSLDCIEKRYQHYKDEGGNSFVHNLMSELRALPRKSPDSK